MTELPAGWAHAQLNEIAEVRLGRQRSPKNHSGLQMRPYIRAANVGWNGLKLDDVKSMNFTDDELEIYQLQPGDIVVSEASGSPGEVGKPAIWSGEIEDCCLQNTLIRVRVRGFGVEPKFLLYILWHEARRGAFIERSRGVGIHHLGATRLASWKIPLPPSAEQRRIVAALDDTFARLGRGERLLAQSELRLKHLYASMMRHVLGLECVERHKLAAFLLEKMINGRSVPTASGGFPVLRLTALQEGRINLLERKEGAWGAVDAQPYLVREGDFFVSRGNGALRLVGRGGLVEDESDPVAFPDTLIRVRVDSSRLRPRYLALVWNSPEVRRQIERSARTTAGIYKVNQSMLSEVLLPVPEPAEQDRLVDQWKAIDAEFGRLRTVVETSVRRASQLRSSLLAEAFAGRLVPQDQNDESASELLARIRAEREAALSKQKTRSGRTRKELPAPPTRNVDGDYQQEALPL